MILNKGYDPQQFIEFLTSKRGPNAADVTQWSMNDLIAVTNEFVQVLNSQKQTTNMNDLFGGQVQVKVNVQTNVQPTTENVQVNVISVDSDTYYDCWYYVELGSETNADLLFFGGWGPDYEDPRTYLNIFLPDNGDMIQNLGLNVKGVSTPEIEALKEEIGLRKFGDLCAVADVITDDNDSRFTKYAEAEAYLLQLGLIRPMNTSGATVQISRMVIRI